MAKKKRQPRLASLDECGQALREVGLLDIRIEGVQARCDKKILDAKSLAVEAAAPDVRRKNELEADLRDYYGAHLGEIETDGRKSVALAVGQMGRRLSHEIKTQNRKKWADVVAAIKRRKWFQFLRVSEVADKDALRTETAETLAAVGCRLTPKQTWWYEVDRTNLEAKG